MPQDFPQLFDVVVAGSDQIWNEEIVRDESPLFFGEWNTNDLRLITYAASYGDGDLPDSTARHLKEVLPLFSALSVRERRAQKTLTDLTGRELAHVLDPTLLLSAQDYDAIAGGRVPQDPYLFMYVLYANDLCVKTARELSRRLGVRCIIAECYCYTQRKKCPEAVRYITPDSLVQYVRHAKYVLSSSFHGTVLGVVFQKPFLSFLEKPEVSESRSGSLLRLIGCEDRLVCPVEKGVEEMQKILARPLPDYSAELARERAKSLAWLESAVSIHQ